MCDYPNCPYSAYIPITVHINGEKTLTLCSVHEEIYQFLKKIIEFEDDWGL
jgi:hypothetical protein